MWNTKSDQKGKADDLIVKDAKMEAMFAVKSINSGEIWMDKRIANVLSNI